MPKPVLVRTARTVTKSKQPLKAQPKVSAVIKSESLVLAYIRVRVEHGCSCGGTVETCAPRNGFGYEECLKCRKYRGTISVADVLRFAVRAAQ